MKLIEIFKNLTDYEDDSLEEITISGVSYKTMPELTPGGVSMGFSFGENNHKTKYNPHIAKAMIRAERVFGEMPLIMQYEVGESFKELKGKLKDNVYIVGEKYEIEPKNTKEILEIMLETIDKENLDGVLPLYFGHPAHMQRILWIGENFGFIGFPFICKEVVWPSENVYSEFVRSPEKWRKREVFVRAHHKILGWI